jgi:enoyl-CoA hydratase
MTYSTLLFELRDGLATITVNRPDKLNALNAVVIAELGEAISRLETDHAVRAVIVTGSGPKAFVAGADIGELARCDSASAEELSVLGSATFRRLERLAKPVAAAINGFALGGGCELAMACHFRVAAEHARMGQPEVKLGTIPGYGGSVRLPRLVGRGRATELLLTGGMVDAQEALRIGLVNRVVPADRLIAETESILRSMLENGPLALAACLHMLDAQDGLLLDQALGLESRQFGGLAATADFKEGTAAFNEKRKASFQGR